MNSNDTGMMKIDELISPEKIIHKENHFTLSYILGQIMLKITDAVRDGNNGAYIRLVNNLNISLTGKIKPENREELDSINEKYEKIKGRLRRKAKYGRVKFTESDEETINFKQAKEIHAILIDSINKQKLIKEEEDKWG